MCDCYTHVCDHKDCNTPIDMHLEDFATKRSEVEVFCSSHLPPKSKRIDGVLWEVRRGKSKFRIFVRSLTKNARKHWRGNHYNGGSSSTEEFGKPAKQKKKVKGARI